VRTIPAEFSPLNWKTGRAYVHDADFDEPTTLADGEVVQLRGEDGTTYWAKVVGVETGRLGRTWTLQLAPGQEEPMRLLTADLTRFTTSGFGTVRGPNLDGLRPGDTVTVTDEGAALLVAVVLLARAGEVDVRVSWDGEGHPERNYLP
jgi:hypothetical protein